MSDVIQEIATKNWAETDIEQNFLLEKLSSDPKMTILRCPHSSDALTSLFRPTERNGNNQDVATNSWQLIIRFIALKD